jgi:hypothetical protein
MSQKLHDNSQSYRTLQKDGKCYLIYSIIESDKIVYKPDEHSMHRHSSHNVVGRQMQTADKPRVKMSIIRDSDEFKNSDCSKPPRSVKLDR